MEDQGEAAFILDVDDIESIPLEISAYALIPHDSSSFSPSISQSSCEEYRARLFLDAAMQFTENGDKNEEKRPSAMFVQSLLNLTKTFSTTSSPSWTPIIYPISQDVSERDVFFTSVDDSPFDDTRWTTSSPPTSGVFGKKYKPVAKKIRPVIGALPDQFRIVRNITGDPLEDIPILNPRPPSFVPTGRYTEERKEALDAVHGGEFLWPEERRLLHHFMMLQNEGFAWEDAERGSFRREFFPAVEIPTIPHIPWIQKNIPIPPGIYTEVCKIIKSKIDSGVYEPSNSSYRSRWFCVAKKDGRLRIVHSLEPLNKVTIQHSGVTPIPEHIAEQFACRPCGAMFDLYVGYDERILSEASRDLTTFQTPFGALRLVTLPMGWTNSVPIFHDDVTYILRAEIPDFTIPYIDDVPVKGPVSTYRLENGSFETIPDNPGIRRFIWEHFGNLNRIVQRMKHAGGTFSGKKLTLCAEEIIVVGHVCTPQGRIPDRKRVALIVAWGPCESLTDLRAFLGTTGLCRIYVLDFSCIAAPLTYLLRKGVEFVFGPKQIEAQEAIKKAIVDAPALVPLDYETLAAIILGCDACPNGAGFFLAQCDLSNPKIRRYSRFGSITFNDRERRFSQAKLELYGLYRAMREFKMYILGVRNLVVEVDAKYIKGMLENPDIAPSASVNRWILAILTFHFELVHVPGTHHGADGLSRRPRQPDDEVRDEEKLDEEFDDWIDHLYGFLHWINPSPTLSQVSRLAAQDMVAASVSHLESESGDTINVFALTTDTDGADYGVVPRSEKAEAEEKRLMLVKAFLGDLKRPEGLSDKEYRSLVRYCFRFFLRDDKLWRRDHRNEHKLVLDEGRRLDVLRQCHDSLGHKGFYATRSLVQERFWWPFIQDDVKWFVQTCKLCQERQLRLVRIPPTVAQPAPLFTKVYVDVLHLPPSNKFRYIIQARCSLTHYPEFRALRNQTAQTVGDWIFEDLLCRWGALYEIVTDNGAPIISACDHLAKKYKIQHIRISGYNSQANGIVERSHFDVRQSLYKACDGDQSKWARALPTVFWAERVTIRRRMGVSPFFAITGTHPVLPLDIVEATYLLPPPDAFLSTTELIARRAVELQKRHGQVAALRDKVFETRVRAARQFEKEHAMVIKDFDFKTGDLVLVRNTAIEKSLNRKMRARYNGPYVIVTRNKGGAYVICELDGSVLDRPMAAFRVVPYFARKEIDIPTEALDMHLKRIDEMRASRSLGDDEEEVDKGLSVEDSDDEDGAGSDSSEEGSGGAFDEE